MFILSLIIKVLLIVVPLLLAVAYFTLVERKIMAGILPTDSSRKQSACRSESAITFGIK